MEKKYKVKNKSLVSFLISAVLTVLMIITIFSVGCKMAESEPAIITRVSVDEVYEMLSSDIGKDYFILDVRSQEEFDSGHIEGAYLIPDTELKDRLQELPRDRPLIVYCRTDNRSTRASNLLLENGFKEIFNMTGGFTDWQSKDYPVIVEK